MTRRKDGRWQEELSYTQQGRRIRKCFYGHTKAEVLRKISAFRQELERGRTFAKVAKEWLTEAEDTVAYNTMKSYRPAYERAVEHFGDRFVREIRPSDVSLFLKTTIKEQSMADKTARTQLLVVNLIFKYAVASGDVDLNPAREISVPKGLTKNRRDIASDEDIARVKASTSCTFGLFALWLLYTGCRRGEALALTWKDVDVENRTIAINKSLYHDNNRPVVKKPKTEAGERTVPMMTRLLSAIKPKRSGIVFPGSEGGYMTETQFQRAWELYKKESGVTCTPHQLRHAYATMLFENDVAESDAQELLGHAQISTTKDIYTHIREARKAKVRDALLDADI